MDLYLFFAVLLVSLILFIISYLILEYVYYKQPGYQKVTTSEVIRAITYTHNHTVRNILKSKSYWCVSLVGIKTYRTVLYIFKEWTLRWLTTYSLMVKVMVVICYVYMSICLTLFLIPYCIIKVMWYYILLSLLLIK